ncbi:MAG: tetratricopeptide repeat protein [Bacteroidales bacterium]
MNRLSLLIILILILEPQLRAQSPPTLPRSATPPDISEKYRANPHFYEIMSAFPNSNSYYMYKFEEVKRNARSDPEAMVILGDHHRLGRSTPKDYKQALKEYQRAAGKGYAKANHRIAYMYADGLGLPKDREKILEFLKQSADGGYDMAQYDCALIYLNGKFNEPRSVEKAYPYLVKASAQGHKLSTELLAMLAFHANSPGTGIPTGLEEALRLFRQAGDTDGERALMQNISTYGGLRYYLRVIPGFIPGIDPALDPTRPEEGLRLLAQLQTRQDLTGKNLYDLYRAEIAENILYHAYFNAQGKMVNLLRFLVFCNEHSEFLSPENGRYIDAAGRDFRLMVNFSDEATLQAYLDEFSRYPGLFEAGELNIIADRVFVALFLKEATESLQSVIAAWLQKEVWPLANLSARYAVVFEQYEMKRHSQDVTGMNSQGMKYLGLLFQRIERYSAESRDSIAIRVITALRPYCVHPRLNGLLLGKIGEVRFSAAVIQPVLTGLEKAEKDILSDINLYYNTLKHDPAQYGVSSPDPELPGIISGSYQKVLEEGKELLDQCCNDLETDPENALMRMEASRKDSPWVLQAGPTQQRSDAVMFEAWLNLLFISRVTLSDPNDVIITPETSNMQIGSEPCARRLPAFCHILQQGIARFSTASLTITNSSSRDIQVRIIITPMETWEGESFNPWITASGYGRITYDWINLPAGESVIQDVEIRDDLSWHYLLPCLEPEGLGFAIPYIKSVSD